MKFIQVYRYTINQTWSKKLWDWWHPGNLFQTLLLQAQQTVLSARHTRVKISMTIEWAIVKRMWVDICMTECCRVRVHQYMFQKSNCSGNCNNSMHYRECSGSLSLNLHLCAVEVLCLVLDWCVTGNSAADYSPNCSYNARLVHESHPLQLFPSTAWTTKSPYSWYSSGSQKLARMP